MEILADEIDEVRRMKGDIVAEGTVVESTEVADDAVDHGGTEDSIFLVDLTLLLETVGRSHAAVWQLCQFGKAVGIGLVVDIDINIRPFGHVEGVGHLEAMAAGDTKSGDELVNIGRAVGGTHLDSLFHRSIVVFGALEGIGLAAHIRLCRPSQRHTHEDGAVTVAPAHVGGCLLMGHETEIRHGVLVAESRDARCQRNHAARIIGELSIVEHTVPSIFHQSHVDMQARTRLARSDFRGKGDIEVHLVSQVTDDPFGNGELVGRPFCLDRKELYLVLLVDHTILHEVSHLGMTVFDVSTRLGYVLHALGAELVGLGIGCRLMVAMLVDGGEHPFIGKDDIILQFAHGVKIHTRDLTEGAARLGQRLFRCALEGIAVLVEEGAEHAERGNLGEGVDEGCGVARDDIKVAAVGLDEGEEAGAVDTLTAGEYSLEIGHVGDDEIEGFQFAIAAGVHEIDHAYLVFASEVDDVGAGEFGRGLLEKRHQGVGVHDEFFVVHDIRVKRVKG